MQPCSDPGSLDNFSGGQKTWSRLGMLASLSRSLSPSVRTRAQAPPLLCLVCTEKGIGVPRQICGLFGRKGWCRMDVAQSQYRLLACCGSGFSISLSLSLLCLGLRAGSLSLALSLSLSLKHRTHICSLVECRSQRRNRCVRQAAHQCKLDPRRSGSSWDA